jgi:hypothetical protein
MRNSDLTCSACAIEDRPGITTKTDVMARWIEREWKPRSPDRDLLTLAITRSCVHQQVIAKFDRAKTLDGGYTFRDTEAIACDAVAPVAQYTFNGDLATQTGAYIYRFTATDGAPEGVDQTVEALVMATHWNDEGYVVALACIPAAFLPPGPRSPTSATLWPGR